ncbi:MAG: DUF7694 domain-containing protein [Thermoplasmata archaeon]
MISCVTCGKSAKLSICRPCAERAEAILHSPAPWTPFEQATIHPDIAKEGFSECYKNSRYTVLWRNVEHGQGELVHLSIKRNDRSPVHDWRDLQRIKNEVLGAEHEAMELYPAESRLIDTANQYHLWCFLGMKAPFGYNAERCVMEDTADMPGARQRVFDEPPKDLMSPEDWKKKYEGHQARKVTRSGLFGQIKSIVEGANSGGCQNPFRYTDERKCEEARAENPESWCGPCMAKVLKKLLGEYETA